MLLDGTDIDRDISTALLRKREGMVFWTPNPSLMSTCDNNAFGPRTSGIRSKTRLDDTVESSLSNAAIWDELKDCLKKDAPGVPRGQQQMFIACALALKSAVLLMDEVINHIADALIAYLDHESTLPHC